MSFDILAPHYRWMELLLAGEKLQRCRTEFLDVIPVCRNILLLGEGHGRGLVECRRRFPMARIACVDASARMLAQARAELARHALSASNVKFIQADILDGLPTAETYDLIITNFFLDCFRPEQLERIVSQLARCADEGANWLIADFQTPADGWRRLRGRLILWLMYRFFRTITRIPAQKLRSPDTFLKQAGLLMHRRVESDWGLLHSDWWTRQTELPAK
jgi:SAM-dependent methyltransferase